MGSGGGRPVRFREDTQFVPVGHAVVDLREKRRGVEATEPMLGNHEDLPDERSGICHPLVALGRVRAQPDGGEGGLELEAIHPHVDI